MLSNKSFGIAGVAMLGTAALLGTNAANALINLDAETKLTVATFAKETLLTAVTGDDKLTYYMVDGSDGLLNVEAEVGVGGTAGSVLILEYTMDGMVFTLTSLPVLTIGADVDTCATTVAGGETATKRAGGGEGQNTVSFILTRSEANKAGTTLACLELEDIAVSTNRVGSVTMKVSDNLPLPATHNAGYPAAVRVEADSLDEVVAPNNPVAAVVAGFKSFNVGTTLTPVLAQVASLGGFSVAITASVPRDAGDATPVVETDLYAAGAATANGVTALVADDDSSVAITGDFSFATKVTLDAATDCSNAATNTDLRMDETVDEAGVTTRVTTALKPQTVAYFNANPNLCISVEDDVDSADAIAIPETAPYEGTINYVGGIATAVFPVMDQTITLGNVVRDGTTVRLPYLTTNERFNQRIYIVNRGGAAKYFMTFHGEDDVGGMLSEGELAANTATILSLGDQDVVTIGPGRTSTAGTLVVEQLPGFIDVATSQINRELGTSDTVVYD